MEELAAGQAQQIHRLNSQEESKQLVLPDALLNMESKPVLGDGNVSSAGFGGLLGLSSFVGVAKPHKANGNIVASEDMSPALPRHNGDCRAGGDNSSGGLTVMPAINGEAVAADLSYKKQTLGDKSGLNLLFPFATASPQQDSRVELPCSDPNAKHADKPCHPADKMDSPLCNCCKNQVGFDYTGPLLKMDQRLGALETTVMQLVAEQRAARAEHTAVLHQVLAAVSPGPVTRGSQAATTVERAGGEVQNQEGSSLAGSASCMSPGIQALPVQRMRPLPCLPIGSSKASDD
jgi:hypothetical protein